MLEYDFNELDNDFATLCSRHLLNHDKSKIGADLEKLAELGQINAIQSYYLFLGKAGRTETNSKIDSKLNENQNSKNFNHLLAFAHRIYATDSEDRKILNDLICTYIKESDEIEQIQEELDYLYLNIETQEIKQKIQALENKNSLAETRHTATAQKILSTKFVTKQREAINACLAQSEATRDPLVFESGFELLTNEISTQLIGMGSNFEKGTKALRSELARIYKKNPSSQVEFALAKNLFFFGEKKNKELGIKMLTKLAKRPLSKTLTEYQLQGENTLEKITHNQKPVTTIKER